jgi:glycosyltransferase involved in cell wall biosynthesis
MFIHTQVPAVLVGRWMRRIPTVVSLDATPIQYDSLGKFYAHERGSNGAERLKRSANASCFNRAAHVVCWADWTRTSLMRDYGVPNSKISVIPPGVDVGRWKPPACAARRDAPVRVLFVGGDLDRKGGTLLLDAARTLRADAAVPPFELHLVTRTHVVAELGVVVHATMTPNSPQLIALYHASHIFCLPTLADCLPMVLPEASVAGLAVISTDVGAISEIVRDGETGLLIPAGDRDALIDALRRLITDSELRSRLAENAKSLVLSDFDAGKNAERLVGIMRAISPRGSVQP